MDVFFGDILSHTYFVGGGGWRDAWLYCCLQLVASIGLWLLTLALSLNPLAP